MRPGFGVRDDVLNHDFLDAGGLGHLLQLIPYGLRAAGELAGPAAVCDDGGGVLLVLAEFPVGFLDRGNLRRAPLPGQACHQGGPGPVQPPRLGVGVGDHGADGEDAATAGQTIGRGRGERAVAQQSATGAVRVACRAR